MQVFILHFAFCISAYGIGRSLKLTGTLTDFSVVATFQVRRFGSPIFVGAAAAPAGAPPTKPPARPPIAPTPTAGLREKYAWVV